MIPHLDVYIEEFGEKKGTAFYENNVPFEEAREQFFGEIRDLLRQIVSEKAIDQTFHDKARETVRQWNLAYARPFTGEDTPSNSSDGKNESPDPSSQ